MMMEIQQTPMDVLIVVVVHRVEMGMSTLELNPVMMKTILILTLALTTATFQVVHPALVILAIVLHPTAVLQARTAETVL